MKTCFHRIEGGLLMYYYDRSVKSWAVITLDLKGFQICDTEYFANKKSLLANYPEFKLIT